VNAEPVAVDRAAADGPIVHGGPLRRRARSAPMVLPWPGDVDEPIVVDYDPAWPSLFNAEPRRVQAALGASVTWIEHFGRRDDVVDLLAGQATISDPAPGACAPPGMST
jgi:hypothetical protein